MKTYKITKGILISKDGDKKTGDTVKLSNERFNKLSKVLGLKEVDESQEKAKLSTNYSLEDLSMDELKEKATKAEITVKGTGKDGRVQKSDYIEALKK